MPRGESADQPDSSRAPLFAIPAAGEPRHILAGTCLLALRAVQRARSEIVEAEATLLARLHRDRAHRALGFSSFADFAREALQSHPRNVRRRLVLAEMLRTAPRLRRAFLEGWLTLCKILALRPLLREPGLPLWIELAQSLTVRELTARVRDAVRDPLGAPASAGADPGQLPDSEAGIRAAPALELDDLDDSDPGEIVTFAAPLSAAAAWESALETARQVLGFDAPPHLCLEAILSETTPDLELEDASVQDSLPDAERVDPDESPSASLRPARNPTPPTSAGMGPIPPLRAADEKRLRKTLSLVVRELAHLEPTTVTIPGDTVEETLHRLEALRLAERPLRVLLGALLRDMVSCRLLHAMGYQGLGHFVELGLGLSERSGRALLSQTVLFEAEPLLTRAFETGRIGLGHAFLIRRVALDDTLAEYLARAEEVTVLHFSREVRFLERLSDCSPTLRQRFPGPFPHPALESALTETLLERGWSPGDLDATRSQFGDSASAGPVGGLGSSDAPAGPRSSDPAEDPALMRRMEKLLHLLMLTPESTPPTAPEETTVVNAFDPGDRQTLSSRERFTAISFWVPRSIFRTWQGALKAVRARAGPIPTWAAAVLIVEAAVREWERHDPARRPKEARILERDRYACQAPGCSARSGLEVHHIVFRSGGGTDDAWNKVTLCHHHHHHGVHAGIVRLVGRAPSTLNWEFAASSGRPRLVFRGHHIVARRSAVDLC